MNTSINFSKTKLFPSLIFMLLISCGNTSIQTGNSKDIESKAYEKIKKNIIIYRNKVQEEYVCANKSEKDSIIKQTQTYLHTVITKELFPKWYGTIWDFNGVTEIPNEGAVACGMFVTIILRDAGFNVSRIKSGQLASETLIKKLSAQIKRFSNAKMEKVITYIKEKPDGLYIVGLDTHIGFITKKGNKLEFVHSNYYSPHVKVMTQKLTETSPLSDSNYRIIGRILDDEMTRKWVMNEKID